MSIQDFAKERLEITKKVYLLSPDRMFSEFKGEKDNVKNYNGRQLLEMIQNADDAASEAKDEKEVLVKLKDNKLIIANTGYPFSQEGLRSIFLSHLSPKEAKEQQIGKKGLGFRSILNWANKVTIKSHDLCVSFSPDHSRTILNDLLLDAKFSETFNVMIKEYNVEQQTPISILACPDIAPTEVEQFDGIDKYDTIIQIDLIDEKIVKAVIEQIQRNLDAEVLLFLNHLSRIIIDDNGEIISYIKKNISKENIIIEVFKNNERVSEKEWNVNSISGNFEDIDKRYQLSLAWQNDFQGKKDVIYSYFKTEVIMKSNGILHGTFELNGDRNRIVTDEEGYNKRLIGLLPTLIAETAEKIAEIESTQSNYKALRFTCFDFDALKGIINTQDLDNSLMEALKKKNIFPVITNKYKKCEDTDPLVYYDEEEFSKYLTPETFNCLMPWCEKEDDRELVGRFTKRKYVIEGVVDDVAQQKDKLTIEEYAKLIVAISKHIYLDSNIKDRALFYDNERKLLKFSEYIFLPNTGVSLDLPSNVGVQIINTELADSLLKLLNCDSYSGLAVSLKMFDIREYKFEELVERLIACHEPSTMEIDEVALLNSNLCKLFLNEGSPSGNWAGPSIPVIDKNNKTRIATKVYFGKEYSNSTIETLYSYDENKILGSRHNMGLADIGEDDVIKYLLWIGVEYYPRKININTIPRQYIIYCLQNFDYRNRIGWDHNFRDYNEFNSEAFNYEDVVIQSIDDFDNILISNKFEDIISWLNEDKDLLSVIMEDKEPKTSKIGIKRGGDRAPRFIVGHNIKSYIKWFFLTSKWIDTMSGTPQAPNLCTTATNVDSDFSPLIEKPKIDYENFKEIGINKNKIDILLDGVGVHKSINTFSTNTLYSILNNLPEINPDGKKAKTIYNQLAVNYEDKLVDKIDKQDPEYVKFHSKGQVFCKNKVYAPIGDSYYANDKRYGEAILKEFNIIEIDRRRGQSKIEKMFGVDRLDKVELNLDGDPSLHNLNNAFEHEIESFKPYVYALRKEVDDGSERALIKDTKFGLVVELKLKLLKKDTTSKLIILKDYEYFYFKNENVVYLKIPTELNDIIELKTDVRFCDTVAEAFSAVLDVDKEKQQIRELFSKSRDDRDELLKTDTDQENLKKLNDAREALGIANNPKIEFWRAFCKCLSSTPVNFEKCSDIKMLEQLVANFGKLSELITNIFNQLNYQHINEEISAAKIVELFKEAKIDIESFNKFYYPPFSISELYEINFKRELDVSQTKFKSLYHAKCADKTMKEGFLDIMYKYNSLMPEVSKSINFNVKAEFYQQVNELFGVDLNAVSDNKDVDGIYKRNYNSISETKIPGIRENLLDQFLDENLAAESLLYFEGTLDGVVELIQEWLGKGRQNGDVSVLLAKSGKLKIGNNSILYNDFGDLKDQIDSISDIDDVLSKIDISDIEIKRAEIEESHKNEKQEGPRRPGRVKAPKEDIGFIGEYFVYKYLLGSAKSKEDVKWVSKYARDCGVNLNGRDGLGYDIEYKPEGDQYPRYVEVKVSDDNAFHITVNEVRIGEKYKSNHEIFLVRNVLNPEKIRVEKLQGIFDYKGRTFNDNDLFSVITDNYIIKFNKSEKTDMQKDM